MGGSDQNEASERIRFANIATATGDELADLVDAAGRSAADGDSDSLDSLLYAIDHHRLADPGIRRVVMEESTVDDVRQDVLIAVTQSIASWNRSGRFTTWLFVVGRNKAVDHVRRRTPVPDSEAVEQLSDAERISSLLAERHDAANLIASLPETYREAVRLRDIEGLSYGEVASTLELPVNTASSRIHRGRAMLAQQLLGAA